ncbi:hypothetical protein [Acuticoccus mangrovi]|uniref:Yip1 domain-containing protein n=1 Tax=Acuticoccus mangrovi TaxID=2796142 RepID=A0A934IPS9_9HYPH|nr:hypothetical protein [Acuticoccus mangrovi]MBJ3775374.1 hypothetical protein [Acuticoccus mangrovi]
MLSTAEITGSLRGAWQLFCNRPDGLRALDRSVTGFWRSFRVIVLLLPINAITMLAVSRMGRGTESFGDLFLGGLPVLLLDWIAFPVVMAVAAGSLGVKATYVSYVVARNWAAPISSAILAIPFILQGAGWVEPTLAVILSLIAMGLVLRYHYLILRIALGTTVPISIGLVIVDMLLSLLLVALLG